MLLHTAGLRTEVCVLFIGACAASCADGETRHAGVGGSGGMDSDTSHSGNPSGSGASPTTSAGGSAGATAPSGAGGFGGNGGDEGSTVEKSLAECLDAGETNFHQCVVEQCPSEWNRCYGPGGVCNVYGDCVLAECNHPTGASCGIDRICQYECYNGFQAVLTGCGVLKGCVTGL
jgi:hypothetical protein